MAVYRMEAKIVSRGNGHSSCASAAYRAGCAIEDERTGELHDYTRKRGVEHSEIMAPEDAPEWAHDRAQLWNAVEAREKHPRAQVARELLLSLPHEMDAEQRRELVREYVRQEYVEKRNLVADVAIHKAHREGDERNHHAHILLTMRRIDKDGWSKNKERDFTPNPKEKEARMREERRVFAEYQNRALERGGIEARVDHRSLKDRGFDREPEPKLGAVASKMEREGRTSHAGDDLRAARERNRERARLEEQHKVISLEIERERRKLEAAFREARVQDNYAKGIAREAANDDREKAQVERQPERSDTTAADGYARGDPAARTALERDPEADLRAAREAALRDRVTGLESQIEGRGKASILWSKITGRVAWDAERQLEAQRAELARMEQSRLRDDQQRHNAPEQAPSQPEQVQERSEPELVEAPKAIPPERQHPERLTIAASDAFHAKDASRAPPEIASEVEEDSKEAEHQAKLEQYREMFRAARENARDGPEMER